MRNTQTASISTICQPSVFMVMTASVVNPNRASEHRTRQLLRLDHWPQVKRTYRVVPGPPRGNSYAQDIANLYGIGFESISQTLRERKVIGRFLSD